MTVSGKFLRFGALKREFSPLTAPSVLFCLSCKTLLTKGEHSLQSKCIWLPFLHAMLVLMAKHLASIL